MTTREYDNSKFFFGMKGKVDGIWYPLSTCDFEDRTITVVTSVGELIYDCADIQELEKFNEQ